MELDFSLRLNFDVRDPALVALDTLTLSFGFSTTLDPYRTFPEPTEAPPSKSQQLPPVNPSLASRKTLNPYRTFPEPTEAPSSSSRGSSSSNPQQPGGASGGPVPSLPIE
jgi:hypothetical protein